MYSQDNPDTCGDVGKMVQDDFSFVQDLRNGSELTVEFCSILATIERIIMAFVKNINQGEKTKQNINQGKNALI